MKFEILDCTLRDGGYYTDWDFNSGLVDRYLNVLDALPIKYCEVGYRSIVKEGYLGEYFYLRRSTLKSISLRINKRIKLAIMLNARDCHPDMIESLLDGCHEFVGIIRIAVSPDQLAQGIAIAYAVKRCGFSVGINLMYLHQLIDNHQQVFCELLQARASIDYLSFVDSFGSCFPNQVKKIVKIAKQELPFKIGYHGHDNLGLAFANSLAAIEGGVDIVDSTMLGLGRGAGNLRTELITAYLSKMQNRENNFLKLADCLEEWKSLAKDKGFKDELDLPYIVSGIESLPQSKVMELMGKKRYASSMIIRVLCKPNAENSKTSQYFPELKDNLDQLFFEKNNISIILGGGVSANDHCVVIKDYARKNNSVIIHSSFKHVKHYIDETIHQFVCLSGDEVLKLDDETLGKLSNNVVFIVTSPPRIGLVPENVVSKNIRIFSVEPLDFTNDFLKKDSPLSLAIGLSQVLECKELFLGGFDGYSGPKQGLGQEVQDVLDGCKKIYPSVSIQSLTATRYEVQKTSIYALID